MTQEFVILTRTYDLLAWLRPKAERFPRLYRRTAVQRLMDAALDFAEALFDAQSQGGSTRQRHLRSADAALNKVRRYLRLGPQTMVGGRYRKHLQYRQGLKRSQPAGGRVDTPPGLRQQQEGQDVGRAT